MNIDEKKMGEVRKMKQEEKEEEEEDHGGDLASKYTKKKLWTIFLQTMNSVFILFVVIIISQQVFLVNTTWNEKIQERESKLKQWNYDCGDVSKPPMNSDIIEICNHLRIIVNSSPFIRALSKVVHGWNSCLTMPCSQLVQSILSQTELKILFVFIAIAIIHHIYRICSYTKKKTFKLRDFLQTQHTLKKQTQQFMHQQNLKQQKNPLFIYDNNTIYEDVV
jgi:hypothetical protein